MSAFEELKAKLKEIFQLDRNDLDFGLYRIMNLKAAEVSNFIDNELLPQVKEGLKSYSSNDKKAIEEELAKVTAMLLSVGSNPEEADKVKELKAKLKDSFDSEKIENEIYSDLYNFFKRYYSEGDFLSLRRYKEGVYALPYEGEEVKLHWANADQYYIKSGETLTNYTFKVKDKKVRFEVVQATTEQNNNKDDKNRRFKLVEENPVRVENNEYIISFSYLPDAQATKQEEINAQSCSKLLINPVLMPLSADLGTLTGNDKNKIPLLRKHLNNFTAKNTFDYFIHKDLGKFLNRELDFYIKNEIMHLDDIEEESAPKVEQYLCKVKVLRKVARKIITFLASLEDFQKKIWLKKKFVLETNYCITLDRVPEELYPTIITNEAQIQEWIKLFAIDELKGYSKSLTIEFLKANPYLVLDTAFFDANFKYKLLASIDDFDKQCDGLLIHSDNFHALNLLAEAFMGTIQCVYIDPPFNTGNDGFSYKDYYQHSSWASMMDNRLTICKRLMNDTSTIYTHIDYGEKERLKLILDSKFNYITEIIWRIGWLSGYKTKAEKFIRNHDTIYQHTKSENYLFNKTYIPYPEGYTRRDGSVPEGKGYPLEDTWNCYELDNLNSIQIISFSKEKVGDGTLTQKNEALIERMLVSSSNKNDIILDFFAGTGSTATTAYKMNRKFIIVEMGEQFNRIILPRLKNVLYGDKYGISEKYNFPKGGLIKYFYLESYEDALDNLQFERTTAQTDLLDKPQNKAVKEEYMLKYMMDIETKGSLLNINQFAKPFDYELKITRNGETKTVKVDLVETFNYLIGLNVSHIQKVKDVLTVEGTTREGEKTLILWRDTGKTSAEDLDKWFEKQNYSTQDMEFDTIYVNGNNNLENLRKSDETWKVRLIEAEFQKRMFDVKDV